MKVVEQVRRKNKAVKYNHHCLYMNQDHNNNDMIILTSMVLDASICQVTSQKKKRSWPYNEDVNLICCSCEKKSNSMLAITYKGINANCCKNMLNLYLKYTISSAKEWLFKLYSLMCT